MKKFGLILNGFGGQVAITMAVHVTEKNIIYDGLSGEQKPLNKVHGISRKHKPFIYKRTWALFVISLPSEDATCLLFSNRS